MALDRKLLEILCCPVTKVPVRLLTADELARVNQAIKSGGVQYADQETVEDVLQSGLITEDDKTIYRIDDDIPIMLQERGIAALQIDGF